MKIGHLVILNAIQDIEDIQGKEQWKVIVYAIPEDWNNKSISESAGNLFRAITQKNKTTKSEIQFFRILQFSNHYSTYLTLIAAKIIASCAQCRKSTFGFNLQVIHLNLTIMIITF